MGASPLVRAWPPARLRAAAPWAALALILAATMVPNPGIVVNPAHHWCWQCGALWLADATSNVLLFVPLGCALAWRGWPTWRVVALAAALTLAVETLQWRGVPPGRLASRMDLLANTLGALAGAAVVQLRGWVRPRTRGAARGAAYGWAGVVVAQGVAVGAALAPAGTVVFDSLPMVSEVTQVPGMGWFEGTIDSVAVDGIKGYRGFAGPVILSTRPSPVAARAAVYVHGRHPQEWDVPLLVLHDAGVWHPWLMVAQQGDDARVTVSRRGGAWGLVMPVLRLPGAFAPDPSPRRLVLEVVTTPPAVAVRGVADGSQGRWAGEGLRPLTPLLGWSLVQAQVRTDARWAWLFHGAWLALLAFPLGWWGAQGVRGWLQGGAMAGVLTVVLVTGLCLPVALFGVAFPTLADALGLGVWGMTGMLAARRGILRHA